MKKKSNIKFECVSEINFETLKNILKDNMNTEYGIKHSFSEIKTVEDYRKYVPLSNYSSFEKYINRMCNEERNILTVYPIDAFVSTSGTASEPKYIPITKKALGVYGHIVEKKKNEFLKLCRKHNPSASRLYIGIFGIDLNKNKDRDILCSEVLYRYLYKNGYMDVGEYVGGKDLLFDENTLDMLYVKVWSAILDENIVLIECLYMYDVLQFFSFFEKNYKEIIDNIRNRVISENLRISCNARKILLNMPVSNDRLNFVEEECSKGFEGIVSRIWPNVKLISGISSKIFEFENKYLDKYIGNIDKDYFWFAMSESHIGVSVKSNSFEYEFTANSAFFEFIECNQKGDYISDAVSIGEVEPGKLYELVLTNFSGLYRYKTNDIIKILSNSDSRVIFEFAFRKNLILNLAGEKMTVKNIEEAMRKMKEIVPNILEYALGATTVKGRGRYYLFLCLSNNAEFDDICISDQLDLILSEVNYVYKKLRELDYVDMPVVFVNDRESYILNTSEDIDKKKHSKPINVLSEGKLQEWIGRCSCNEK